MSGSESLISTNSYIAQIKIILRQSGNNMSIVRNSKGKDQDTHHLSQLHESCKAYNI